MDYSTVQEARRKNIEIATKYKKKCNDAGYMILSVTAEAIVVMKRDRPEKENLSRSQFIYKFGKND